MAGSKRIFSKIFAFISIIIAIIFAIFLNKYNILPQKYRYILIFAIFLFLILYIFLLFRKKRLHIAFNFIFILLLILLNLGEISAISYGNKSINTLEAINKKEKETETKMSFVVLKESDLMTTSDIGDEPIAVAEGFDRENNKKALESLDKDLKLVNKNDYVEAGLSLLNGESQVMVLNEGFRGMLDEAIDGFSEKTRVLDSVLIKDEKKKREKVEENESFNVYISGIDTYGDLSNVSRSDVNMVVSVNPKNGKILITSIPRDTYLNIGAMGKDKLTHAGLFGVDTSIESLENLLDIDIDYYARVNFTSLMELVDVLGGIKVENPTAFTSSSGKYTFPQGDVYMDGDMALAYARERYHLEEGDFDRGKNHARIMAAIIRRLLSPDMLLNFNSIADIALNSVNTDMPYEKMIELVNNQIEQGQDWDIESQSLEGYGQAGLTSLLMPYADLYMMVPYDESVEQIGKNIDLNNE